MPHVGRKQDQIARFGLHEVLGRERRSGRQARLTELEPALVAVIDRRRQLDVKGRRDPAELVDMIDVMSAGPEQH